MTALQKYQRLECPGLWRAGPQAQRRDVVAALRDASLVLTDPRSETPLSHWSLPAVERLNPGQMPALYSPDRGEGETLEIDDAEMIAALETVHRAVERRRPHPGRLRGSLVLTVLAALGMLATFWLPGAMSRHAARVLPEPARTEIGQAILADVLRLTGSACDAALGRKAAANLAKRLAPAGVRQVLVLREALPQALALPGGIVLLHRSLVEQAEDAETAAGFALAEMTRNALHDPVVAALDHAGPLATARLLATGRLPEAALDGIGEGLIAQAPAPLSAEVLLGAFQAAKLSPRAYAMAIEDDALEQADPFQGLSPEPALADRDWVSLQAICTP